jgi:hypothetical protein
VQPGSISIDVKTWKPLGGIDGKMKEFFLGSSSRLRNMNYVENVDKLSASINRFGVQSGGSGSITFRVNTVVTDPRRKQASIYELTEAPVKTVGERKTVEDILHKFKNTLLLSKSMTGSLNATSMNASMNPSHSATSLMSTGSRNSRMSGSESPAHHKTSDSLQDILSRARAKVGGSTSASTGGTGGSTGTSGNNTSRGGVSATTPAGERVSRRNSGSRSNSAATISASVNDSGVLESAPLLDRHQTPPPGSSASPVPSSQRQSDSEAEMIDVRANRARRQPSAGRSGTTSDVGIAGTASSASSPSPSLAGSSLASTAPSLSAANKELPPLSSSGPLRGARAPSTLAPLNAGAGAARAGRTPQNNRYNNLHRSEDEDDGGGTTGDGEDDRLLH